MKKMIPALGLAIVLLIATGSPMLVLSQNQSQTAFQEEISNEVLIAVCLKLEKDRVASAATILGWYRNGEMTITKIESGVYAVVLPGGGGTLVEMDNL